MTPSPARKELAQLIEHTLRKADATREEIERLCSEANANGFASVCVNGSRVVQAAHFLEGTEVRLTCAVAFPLGASDADVKRFETEAAIDGGANFVEVAANLGRLKDGEDAYVLRELRDVVEAADERPVSVYLDLRFLTPAEIGRVAQLAIEAGAKGAALAGGFDSVTKVEAVRLVREVAGESFGIKIDQETAALAEIIVLLEAGATRFGLENGVKLVETT